MGITAIFRFLIKMTAIRYLGFEKLKFQD